jgi:glutamate synthase (ferredoxin)
VLGTTGRNFAAGMSGGVAYVLDDSGDFYRRCNQQMAALEKVTDAAEIEEIRQMIKRHAQYTGSQRAERILAFWDEMVPKFVKVMPNDYKRMLQAIQVAQAAGLSGEEALLAAFENNAKDVARVGGS